VSEIVEVYLAVDYKAADGSKMVVKLTGLGPGTKIELGKDEPQAGSPTPQRTYKTIFGPTVAGPTVVGSSLPETSFEEDHIG